MISTMEQWKEVMDAANLDDGDILETVKKKLMEKNSFAYGIWEIEDFSLDSLFSIKCTTCDQGLDLRLPLLSIAAFNGHLDIVKYLVDDKGVNLGQRGNCFGSALHLAAFNGHLDIVKYLVDDKKVNLDQKDYFGRSALHLAAFNGHLDIVKYLVDDKKVNLDQKDYSGRSALHSAAQGGRKDIVATLLEKKANYFRDKHGKTPRDLAKDRDVRQLLKEIDQITSKTIKAGITSSIITALIVGIGCDIFDVELSILAIVSIAAALVIGTVAASIAYLVLKPSNKLDKPDLEIANQQVDGKVY